MVAAFLRNLIINTPFFARSVALLFLGLPLWPALAQAESLPEAVGLAIKSSPELRAALANRRAVGETIIQARSGWLPSADASTGVARETSDNPSTRALGGDQTLTRREAEISVSQLLFDGGNVGGQVRRSEARADAAWEQAMDAAETAAAQTALAYLDVARLRGLVSLGADNAANHQKTLEQVDVLADSGRGRRSDSQQADARLSLAQASLSQLKAQLAQAEAAYRRATGQSPGVLADPGNFQSKLPGSFAEGLEQGLARHPAIRSAEKDLLAAGADRESARSRLVAPRIALEAGATHNNDLDGIRGGNADKFMALRLRYNFFRGGADQSRIREAEARIDEAQAAVARARSDVERDYRQAWDMLQEDRARLTQLGRYVAASTEVVVAYRGQFSLGQRSLLDVLNAENELFTAKSSLYSGLYAVTSGELRVLSAIGGLLAALGIERIDEGAAR